MRLSLLVPAVLLVGGAALATTGSLSRPNTIAATYAIDTTHSSVLFRIKHFDVAYFYGRFATYEGTFTLDDDASKCAVEVKIDAGSVDSFNEGRDDHIKGGDFLDAKQHPDLTFKSTKVERDGDAFTITGDLTGRGVTRSVTCEMQKTGEAETRFGLRAGFEGRFVFKRSDFGMDKGDASSMLSDEVTMILAIEGVKQ
jgi:polyisoprenoid-binding protein YceI